MNFEVVKETITSNVKVISMGQSLNNTVFQNGDNLEHEISFDDFVLTEIGISNLFAGMNIGKLKFNFKNSSWYYYDGKIWNLSEKNEIVEIVKAWIQTIKQLPMFQDSDSKKWFKTNSNRSKINNILKLASSNLNLATTSNDFDIKPELINFTNGTFNLKSLSLQPHNPDDLITKIIDFEYDPNASSPYWDKFIK
jgi:putative DNA primase/helicase